MLYFYGLSRIYTQQVIVYDNQRVRMILARKEGKGAN